ncbi:hypothetical protein EU805_07685 [Salipiger sp. IMCC34102]|uniref:DUF6151 family protein n=1 Tax=Salipiger sp. IMCC34102 TaxID=2510647 RepID=UPI00101C5B17|nr:DUF6151 family protein [Salipiger sp. IMCC34102]RYH03581.1 hypothetical protein EU805_07685 [Salipiger sp. IMCC34102]
MDLSFACRCGALSGTLEEADASDGRKMVCYCRDCRAAARHFGVLDALEPGGGSPLVQVLPARLKIAQGADKLGCLRLSPKGLHRWHATCCGTPVANTIGAAAFPLAGIWLPLLSDRDGIPGRTAQVFTKQARPRAQAPRRDRGVFWVAGGIASRGIGALRDGRLRAGPFFTDDGEPVAVPHVLTTDERRAAYAK